MHLIDLCQKSLRLQNITWTIREEFEISIGQISRLISIGHLRNIDNTLIKIAQTHRNHILSQ